MDASTNTLLQDLALFQWEKKKEYTCKLLIKF
jgi:hypothetical protein